MKKLLVVFPNQLFSEKLLPKKADLILMQHKHFYEAYHYHAVKLSYHFLSTNYYLKEIKRKIKVLSDFKSLETHAKKYEEVLFFEAVNKTLGKEISRLQKKIKTVTILENPQFLFSKDELTEMLGEKDKYLMASFYIKSRRKLDILVKDDKPVGGKWSFDSKNRESLDDSVKVPRLPKIKLSDADTKDLIKFLKGFKKSYGDYDNFIFPYKRNQLRPWLDAFFSERFKNFGRFQDAIHPQYPFLFHSCISPMVNSGLLTPAELLAELKAYTRTHKIPLNSEEGFIRQVIGWREFMRGMYEILGPKMETNFFKHKRKIPKSFYTGETGIIPIDLSIKKLLKYSYLHHIERLMIVGNFMLLCEFDPKEVYRWFMELFVDAYDWVMAPNVYGMSQFADGGLFVTKPYVSSSNYVKKMAKYPKGEWEAVWDGLYWRFVSKHAKFLSSNPRMRPMTFALKRMSQENLATHKKNADQFLKTLK